MTLKQHLEAIIKTRQKLGPMNEWGLKYVEAGFYLGAGVMLSEMLEIGKLPQEEALKRIDALEAEVMEWAKGKALGSLLRRARN